MISLRDRLVLAASLLSLLGAGGVGGYWIGRHRAAVDGAGNLTAVTGPGENESRHAPEAIAAVSPADWWSRALDRLGADLNLSDDQKRAVQPLLQEAGGRMFVSRDRAMFQIHLQLLEFHEVLARNPDLLAPAQAARLAALRVRLRQAIETQFPQFLKDSPLPATAANGPAANEGPGGSSIP